MGYVSGRAPSMPYHCDTCGIGATWRITRRGDDHVGWACPDHLHTVCDSMQRDSEVTELLVVLIGRLVEWAEIEHRLGRITRDDPTDQEGRP